MSRDWSLPRWIKVIVLLLVLALPLAANAAPVRQPNVDAVVYLPIVLRPGASLITARVTDNGAPAAGVAVELRYFDNLDWSSAGFATTDGNGYFRFENPAALGPGEKYYVRYLNPSNSDDNRLAAWFTRELTSYAAGSEVNIGDFDLANVALTAPDHQSTVGLPRTFEWDVRPASPQDSYELYLFDDEDGVPSFVSGPLGYEGSYTLNSLPPGFNAGAIYAWTVTIYASESATGPTDAYGLAFWYNYVTFSNAGARSDTGQWQEGSTPPDLERSNLQFQQPSIP
jgi:hypothetical protein